MSFSPSLATADIIITGGGGSLIMLKTSGCSLMTADISTDGSTLLSGE